MRRGNEGSALMIAMVTAMIITGLVVMLFEGSRVLTMNAENARGVALSRAAAQTGLDLARAAFLNPADTTDTRPERITAAGLGSSAFPLDFGAASFWTEVTESPDQGTAPDELYFITIRSTAVSDTSRGAEARTVLESVIKCTVAITPPASGTNLLPGAVCASGGGNLNLDITSANARINGYDHNEDGSDIPAAPGVAGLAGTGGGAWTTSDGSKIIAAPPIDNAATIDAAKMAQIIQYVKNNTTSTSSLFADGGSIGASGSGNYAMRWVHATAALEPDPVTGEEQKLVEFAGGFHGYGILLITADDISKGRLLHMAGQSSWTGLIIIEGAGTRTIGTSLVHMVGGGPAASADRIVGGLAMSFAAGTSITGTGPVLKLAGKAQMIYSGVAVSNATSGAVSSSTETYGSIPGFNCRRAGP